jgi:pSer/pThr/pTyr-binding forkhead associated (FHA) protein
VWSANPAYNRGVVEKLTTRDDDERVDAGPAEPPIPGLVLFFSRGLPTIRAIRVDRGPVTLGRDDCGGVPLDDDRASRAHVRVARAGAAWKLKDLGSKNGTFVDGQQLAGELDSASARVLRIGHSLFVLLADVRPYLDAAVEIDGDRVAGPVLQRVNDRIARAARTGDHLLISGESGSGKELAARLFH